MNKTKEALRSWILKAGKTPPTEEFTYSTPIIEKRIISSLQVMDLILEIERLSGKRIEIEQLKPGAFRDIESIYATFFGHENTCGN